MNRKKTATLLIAIFILSIFSLAIPVIEASSLYWVKASIGGEFNDYSPGLYRCTLGLIGTSLSAVETGESTAYKGSGVFVDHDQDLVVHLDIAEGILYLEPDKTVILFGTTRVKDLNLKDKWTGTFILAFAYREDGSYGSTLTLLGEKYYHWSGSVGGAGEAKIWIWE